MPEEPVRPITDPVLLARLARILEDAALERATREDLQARYGGRTTLSVPEAAGELGIAKSTAYRLIAKGTFPVPALRIGRQLRVSVPVLARYLDR